MFYMAAIHLMTCHISNDFVATSKECIMNIIVIREASKDCLPYHDLIHKEFL